MFRAKLHLELETDCVLSRVTDRWNTSFTVPREEVIDDDHVTFVVETGDRMAEFVEAFQGAEEVTEVSPLDDDRLMLTKRPCGALPIIRDHHGMLQGWDQVNGAHREFDIIVFRRNDLRGIVAELREIGTVDLLQLVPFDDAESLLSERQAEVASAALRAGYFEWPRETDAETLAEALGISHTTLLEHLRKAERTIFTYALRGGPPGEEGGSLDAFPLAKS